jgi:hypothetical protein
MYENTKKRRDIILGCGPESDITALKGMLEAYTHHLNSGNFDEWLSLCSKNGVQMMPYIPARVSIKEMGT